MDVAADMRRSWQEAMSPEAAADVTRQILLGRSVLLILGPDPVTGRLRAVPVTSLEVVRHDEANG